LIEFCREKEIILYSLLANSTHIIQPADVGIFGPLKKKWFHESRQWYTETNKPVDMYNIAKVKYYILHNFSIINISFSLGF
jgi:hypothetical protein